MNAPVFNPPASRIATKRLSERRAHLLSEIERAESHDRDDSRRRLFRLSPRRQLVWAIAVVLLLGTVGGAIAVGADLLAQQNRVHSEEAKSGQVVPQPRGDSVEIAAGTGWSFIAWKSDQGICVDYAVPGNYVSACGFPVIGAPSNGRSAETEPPARFVAGLETTPSPEMLVVAGPAASSVARIEVQLADGRRVEAQLFDSPAALQTPLRFFLLRVEAQTPSSAEERPHPTAEVFRAYDDAGRLLEESSSGFGY